MVLNSNDNSKSLLEKIEGLCFYVIALNLLWSFFADSFLTHFFLVACVLIFGIMIINSVRNIRSYSSASNALLYFSIILWSLIMVFVYEFFYPVYSKINFLFITADSHSVFFMRVLVAIVPCIAFSNRNSIKFGKLFKAIVLIVLIISFIYTTRAIIVDPDAIRARAVMRENDLGHILKYTPPFAMVYSYALLIPWFVHKCCFTTGKNKWFYIVCTLLLAYIILVSQFATALIIAIIGALVYLLFVSKNRTRLFIAILSIVVLYIIIFMDGGAEVFNRLANNVQGAWSLKLKDIATVLAGGEDSGSISGRQKLYKESIIAFFKSPVIGKFLNETGNIGGHATGIDVLGLTGLLGFIPFMLSIYSNSLRMKKNCGYNKIKSVVVASTVQFVILVFTKNIITSLAIFFTYFAFIPLLVKSEGNGEMGHELNKNNGV